MKCPLIVFLSKWFLPGVTEFYWFFFMSAPVVYLFFQLFVSWSQHQVVPSNRSIESYHIPVINVP